MTYLTPLFAQLGGLNPLTTGQPVDRGTGMVFRDLVLILGIGAAVTLLLVLWARHYVRNKQRRRKVHGRSHSSRPHAPSTEPPAGPAGPALRGEDEDEQEDEAEEQPGAASGRRRRRRRRRRQRDHRPRNPTLAQTGGLPPPKGPAAGPSGP